VPTSRGAKPPLATLARPPGEEVRIPGMVLRSTLPSHAPASPPPGTICPPPRGRSSGPEEHDVPHPECSEPPEENGKPPEENHFPSKENGPPHPENSKPPEPSDSPPAGHSRPRPAANFAPNAGAGRWGLWRGTRFGQGDTGERGWAMA
jgi:hypothetical protein